VYPAVVIDEPGRERALGEPPRRRVTEHDRGGVRRPDPI
jgi:hypothetical protein